MSSALSPTQSIKNEEQILHSFEISGDLRIRDSEKIISDLSVLISENKNILVDLSELSSIDTSIFQILVATTRSAEKKGLVVQLDNYEDSPIPLFMSDIGLDSKDIGGIWYTSSKKKLNIV